MDYQFLLNRRLAPSLVTIGILYPTLGHATPWLDTGDVQLRHELQLLSDEGLLKTPITTWPLSTKDIHANLSKPDTSQVIKSEIQNAYNHVSRRLEAEDYGSSFKVGGSIYTKQLLIRDFSSEGRNKYQAYYDGQWGDPILDARLKISLADKSDHPNDKTFRLDESYLASSFGNWKFTLGRQSRWWGPGWDGSLILSNNARPIPSISLDRIDSAPFKNKYLKWMGPWKLNVFAGQLESSRAIPQARLIGARLNFKPSPNFEVGLSRTAQWGGKGRPQSISSLFNSIIGKDNFYSTDAGKINEPGNQLAGIDFRWKSPLGIKKPIAIYGQLIGEDEAGKLPYKNIGLLGIETWQSTKSGSMRIYLEASDTSTDFYQGKERNNTAYNHSIYKSGYRYQDLSLGHSIDSDSRLYSAGVILSKKNGNFWRVWAKHASLNTDNKGKNPIAVNIKKWSALGVSLNRNLDHRTKLNFGFHFISETKLNDSRSNNASVSIGFSRSF